MEKRKEVWLQIQKENEIIEQRKKDYQMELEDVEAISFEQMISEQELEYIKQGVMEKIRSLKKIKEKEQKETEEERKIENLQKKEKEIVQKQKEYRKFSKWYHWKKWKMTVAVAIVFIFIFCSPSLVSFAGKIYENLSIAEKISGLFQGKTKQDGYRLDIKIEKEKERKENKENKDTSNKNNNEEIESKEKSKKREVGKEEQKENLMQATSFIKNVRIVYPSMQDYKIREKDGWYYFHHKDGVLAGKDFDLELIAVDQEAETGLFVEDIANMEETILGGHKIIYIEQNDVAGSRYHYNISYKKQMIILFEEEGYIIKLYSMEGVEKEKLLEFSENLSLEKCEKKQASSYITLSEYFMHNFDTKGQKGNPFVKTIKKEQIVSIQETASYLGIEYEVQEVQVFDNISKFWKKEGKGFSDAMNLWEHRFQYADKNGNLKSYFRETIEEGDGITAPLQRVIASEEIFQKFVLVELRVKNTTMQEKEAVGICLNMNYLTQQENDWIDDRTKYCYYRPKIIGSCQLDCIAQYFQEAEEGAGFYLKTLAPEQEKIYHIGYFVDEDLLSSMFLSVDGNVWTGEYNGTMIDIRQ